MLRFKNTAAHYSVYIFNIFYIVYKLSQYYHKIFSTYLDKYSYVKNVVSVAGIMRSILICRPLQSERIPSSFMIWRIVGKSPRFLSLAIRISCIRDLKTSWG